MTDKSTVAESLAKEISSAKWPTLWKEWLACKEVEASKVRMSRKRMRVHTIRVIAEVQIFRLITCCC
jgi:hypothetical protein